MWNLISPSLFQREKCKPTAHLITTFKHCNIYFFSSLLGKGSKGVASPGEPVKSPAPGSSAPLPHHQPQSPSPAEARRKSILKHSDSSAASVPRDGPSRGSTCRPPSALSDPEAEHLLGSGHTDDLHQHRRYHQPAVGGEPPSRAMLSPTADARGQHMFDGSLATTTLYRRSGDSGGVSHSSSLGSPPADHRRMSATVAATASMDDFRSSSSSREGTPLLGRRGASGRQPKATDYSVRQLPGTVQYMF